MLLYIINSFQAKIKCSFINHYFINIYYYFLPGKKRIKLEGLKLEQNDSQEAESETGGGVALDAELVDVYKVICRIADVITNGRLALTSY